jgi:uncharacterized tellurite resistance protein B-like protein
MSFLRNMFSGSAKNDDPRRFIVESMLGAMEADGDVSEAEMEVLQKNLEDHELFRDLTDDARARYIDMAADSIRDAGGGHKRLDAIAKGLPSRGHRMTAFAMACEVCACDAELLEGEIRFLEQLQRALALDEETAEEIFEAARKNSGLLTIEEKTRAMRAMMPAFVDCMALMAAADGEVHDTELTGVRAVLRNIPDMAVLTRDELDSAIQKAFQRIRDKDCDGELESIANSTITAAPDRYWTTVYMMIIALADGTTDWREVRFLETARRVFHLNETQMDQAMATASAFPAVDLGGKAPN